MEPKKLNKPLDIGFDTECGYGCSLKREPFLAFSFELMSVPVHSWVQVILFEIDCAIFYKYYFVGSQVVQTG